MEDVVAFKKWVLKGSSLVIRCLIWFSCSNLFSEDLCTVNFVFTVLRRDTVS